MLVRSLVRPSIRPWLVRRSVGSHDEILRRGEERGRGMMSKTGYIEIVSRLVTVTRSLFYIPIRFRISPAIDAAAKVAVISDAAAAVNIFAASATAGYAISRNYTKYLLTLQKFLKILKILMKRTSVNTITAVLAALIAAAASAALQQY
jgi:hypothetical protein